MGFGYTSCINVHTQILTAGFTIRGYKTLPARVGRRHFCCYFKLNSDKNNVKKRGRKSSSISLLLLGWIISGKTVLPTLYRFFLPAGQVVITSRQFYGLRHKTTGPISSARLSQGNFHIIKYIFLTEYFCPINWLCMPLRRGWNCRPLNKVIMVVVVYVVGVWSTAVN